MKDISENIKKVMLVFLLLFMGLIVYMTYFEFFVGPKVVVRADNRRLWEKRNSVLRGTIYDRNMKPLAQSTRNGKKQIRNYEYGKLFAHVIGYENEKYGLTGIEKKYDKDLMSASNVDLTNVFNFEQEKKEKKGYNLITSLDYNVQKKAYNLLGDNKGAIVVLNPKTGDVISLVSKPSFDPNKLDADTWKELTQDKNFPILNRAVSGLYPPGSTFKTVTAISALENIDGILNKTIQDNGSIYFNHKYKLSNFQGEVLGNLNLERAFIHSSNVYFGTIGMKLGNSKLLETAEKFEFNKDIPSSGLTIDNSRFPKYKKYEIGNIAQSAIGQSGVLATPIQMALVASTIANNGVMMEPKIVSKITNADGKDVRNVESKQISQVTSERNANLVKKFMRETVEKGTARAALDSNYEICGKTGTADHKNDGELDSSPHSWFIGFAPYKNPQVAIAVIVENGGQGGGKATRIATSVINEALKNK